MSPVSCLFMSTTRSSNRISVKSYQGKMHFFWTSRSLTFHARLGIAIIKHDKNGIEKVIEKNVSQSHIYYWKKKKKNGTQQQPYKLLNKNTHLVLLRIQCTFSTRLRTKGGYINGLSLWQCFNRQSNLIIKWAYYSKFLGKISHRFRPHRRWVVLVLIRSSGNM